MTESSSSSSSSCSSSSVVSTLDVDGLYTLQAREIYASHNNEVDMYRQVVVATIDAKDASKLLKLLTEKMNLSQYGVSSTASISLCIVVHLISSHLISSNRLSSHLLASYYIIAWAFEESAQKYTYKYTYRY